MERIPRGIRTAEFRAEAQLPVAPNLLDRQFAVTAPNKAWVTDIACIATDEDWL